MNFIAIANKTVKRGPNVGPVYPWDRIRKAFLEAKSRSSVALYFYRHGETISNAQDLISGQDDSPLSNDGFKAARSLREKIPYEYGGVFCSELKRSQQTMQTALGLDQFFTSDERLNEFDFGLLTGKKRYFIKEFSEGDIDYRPPGGETYREFAQRVFSFIVDIIYINNERCPNEDLYLIFAHAGVLRVVGSLKFDGPDTAKDMLKSNYKNLEALVINSNQCKLPDFWLL